MKKVLSYLCIVLVLTGCGTTQVMVNSPRTDIYIDNVHMGKGSVEITRMGPPKRKNLVAKHEGTTVGQMEIKRKFDVLTALIGIYTYGVGFIVGWRYPSVVIIPTEQIEGVTPASKNPWMDPPKVWGSK